MSGEGEDGVDTASSKWLSMGNPIGAVSFRYPFDYL